MNKSSPESPAKEQPSEDSPEDRETMRRDFERGVYEREAKEQPGEQNAAPQVPVSHGAGQPLSAHSPEIATPAVAAPDLPPHRSAHDPKR